MVPSRRYLSGIRERLPSGGPAKGVRPGTNLSCIAVYVVLKDSAQRKARQIINLAGFLCLLVLEPQ